MKSNKNRVLTMNVYWESEHANIVHEYCCKFLLHKTSNVVAQKTTIKLEGNIVLIRKFHPNNMDYIRDDLAFMACFNKNYV